MIKELYSKYKNIIAYIFWGICTTIVNIISYWILTRAFNLGTMISTIIAWILAILLAYFTNRKWVFNSKASTIKEILQELNRFFIARIATGLLDWACMFIFVDQLHLNDMIIKTIANIIVIIMNYVASKLLVFKK